MPTASVPFITSWVGEDGRYLISPSPPSADGKNGLILRCTASETWVRGSTLGFHTIYYIWKMTSAEDKLRERIKELTCLYEVSSIIVNTDYDELDASMGAIAWCLKRAWLYPDQAFTHINLTPYEAMAGTPSEPMVAISSVVKVFNEPAGSVLVGYPGNSHTMRDFLEEEQKLLDNVSLALGNLLERKQIRDNEALIKRQVERADRLNILGEITAGIAHELNTPLANILGFAELLKDSVPGVTGQRDLQKIADSAIYCREVVKKLMFFACEMPQHIAPVLLAPVLTNVLNLLRPSLQAKDIQVELSHGNEHQEIKADTIQLTQVLFNLIMNSVYYSPRGGRLGIEVEDSADAVLISIADEGSGIEEGIADRIFEPFFTTKTLGEGSGLGLSVVHGIMNSHRGSIRYRPNDPKGAEFILSFPK